MVQIRPIAKAGVSVADPGGFEPVTPLKSLAGLRAALQEAAA